MTNRIALIAFSFALVASSAEAAYRARVVVPPGPFFGGPAITYGPEGYQAAVSTKGAEAIANHLVSPGGIAVLGTGEAARAYIADVFTLREVNLNTGEIRNMLPVSGDGLSPSNVGRGKLDDRDVVLASSWVTGRVIMMDPITGDILRDERDFAAPHDVVMLPDGDMIVAEADAQKLTRVKPDGTREVFADGFQRPVGLALSTDDILYVTDAKAGTVERITMATGEKRILTTKLAGPEGITILPSGHLAVVETGRSMILDVNPADGTTDRLATNVAVSVLPSGFPTDPQKVAAAGQAIFNGIAVTADGVIYLPSDVQTTLYVLKEGGGPTSFLDALRGLTSGLFR